MPQLSRQAYIDVLLAQHFPPRILFDLTGERPADARLSPLERSERDRAKRKYRKQLDACTIETLKEMVRAVSAGVDPEVFVAASLPQVPFFNLPDAFADFSYWTKLEYWSLDEAVALAMGRDPEKVSWALISDYAPSSPVAKEYGRMREIVARARMSEKLPEMVAPAEFVKWAQQSDVRLPKELLARVQPSDDGRIDWKARYEELVASSAQDIAALQGAFSERDQAIAAKDKEIAHLRVELEALQKELSDLREVSSSAKPQSARERSNMLKVIYGVARSGRYKYDPAKRNDAVPRIKSDLELMGLHLSDDTIARYLKEAVRLTSTWSEE